jgi:SAM-dependent methyltransferase
METLITARADEEGTTVEATEAGMPEAADLVQLHYRNVKQLGERDVVIAAYRASGNSLLGNILMELGFGCVDPYTEVVGEDGQARVIRNPGLLTFRSRLAATADADEGRQATGPGTESGLRFFKNQIGPEHFTGVPLAGAILLVRDPRDTLYSSYRSFRDFATFWMPGTSLGQGTFADFLDGTGINGEPPIQGWVDFYRDWYRALPGLRRTLVIRFEDMKADPVATTEEVLRVFGVECPREAVERAVERSSYENMRAHEERVAAQSGIEGDGEQPLIMRRGKVDEWREWFGEDPALAAKFRDPRLVETAALFGYHLAEPESAAPRTQFDYSPYAATYRQRAEYVPSVVRSLLLTAGVAPGDLVCDMGAGSGHLTEPLLEYGLRVEAVEPTPAMRAVGERRTAAYENVSWHEGTGEASGRPAGRYALVAFGSSFDRTDRPAALAETARILTPTGWFACLWNHRVLEDPLQARVEELIHDMVPGYGYGVRRTDQTQVIAGSGLFEPAVQISGEQVFRLCATAWCDAWESHSTLGQQAGPRFGEVVDAIRELVRKEAGEWIDVPYVTRGWIARRCTADTER